MYKKLPDYWVSTQFFDNTKNLFRGSYHNQSILSLKGFEKANKEITSWDQYQVTPLHYLSDLAKHLGLAEIYYKDEYHRFSLKSFKALGGAYGVAELLVDQLKKIGVIAQSYDLENKKYYEITKNITVCCATDGNHGKSVAWGAQRFGCKCEIYLHSNVSKAREAEIAKYGAKVIRVDGNYDDSVKMADKVASEKKYFVVSDNSYPGYTDVPKLIMQGYTIMVDEALKQINELPTHIFLQGGCGGLAAAVVAYIIEKCDETNQFPPIFVIVEPNNANCLLKSAQLGRNVVVDGELKTIMAGLACGEVSLLAWEILKKRVRYFFSIEDEPIYETIKLLSSLTPPIVAGESAVAGLTVLWMVGEATIWKKKLLLDKNSKVLVFGTEGDTDEDQYKKIVGKSAKDVLSTQ